MRTAGYVLIALGVVVPVALLLYGVISERLENRRYGPPMEDAFTPVARVIDLVLLAYLGLAFILPGALLLLLA